MENTREGVREEFRVKDNVIAISKGKLLSAKIK